MNISKILASCFMITVSIMVSAEAKTFYIDPAVGNTNNDGSQDHPWKTLQEVVDGNKIQTRAFASNPYNPGDTLMVRNSGAPVNAGDTLLLNTGYHGDITIQAAINSDYITISAAPGQLPRVNHLSLSGASKWNIRGLTVSAEFDTVGHNRDLLFINSEGWAGPSRDITVENCSLYTIKNSSAWTMNDWGNYTCTGARMHGKSFIFSNNFVSNVDIGIRVVADSCLIEKNVFENYSSCGMRLCGANNCSFNYNIVRGFHMVNNIFGMGFQGYSQGADGTVGGGVVSHVSVVGNTIINTVDPNQAFKGQLYGIACFDGIYDDWVVENNVVLANTWYGIAFNGARNCRIINNTVCRLDTLDCSLPSITVSDYTNGIKSTNCVIRNNFSSTIVNNGDSTCSNDHNISFCNPDSFFMDYKNGDVRLKAGSAGIDSGSSILAPQTDIVGISRPQGKAVDIGAFEYVDPTIVGVSKSNRVSAKDGKLIVSYNRSNRTMQVYIKTASSIRLVNETDGYSFIVYDIHGRQCSSKGSLGKISLNKKGQDSKNGMSPGVYVVAAQNGSVCINTQIVVR